MKTEKIVNRIKKMIALGKDAGATEAEREQDAACLAVGKALVQLRRNEDPRPTVGTLLNGDKMNTDTIFAFLAGVTLAIGTMALIWLLFFVDKV